MTVQVPPRPVVVGGCTVCAGPADRHAVWCAEVSEYLAADQAESVYAERRDGRTYRVGS